MGKYIRRAIAVLLTVTALIVAILPPGSANAATSTHGDFEYDGNTISKYLGNATSVTVPNWVNRIGKDAFSGNTTLEKIVLPDSVSTIDFAAFENCINLRTADIPDSVRTIGSSAFSGCKSLKNISIPAKCESIGSGAFAGCNLLDNVNIDPTNPYYTCQDGVVYSSDGTELVQYLAGRPFTTYEMPESIAKIDEYAFWGATNLGAISISSKVDAIPEYAFDNCDGLVLVTLPRSVERINAYSFADCSNLIAINIPDSVGYIDENAFYMTNGAKVRFVDANGNPIKIVAAEDADDYVNGSNVEDVADADIPQESVASDNGNEIIAEQEQSQTMESQSVLSPNYNGSFSGETSWVSEINNTDYTQNTTAGEIGSSKVVGGNVMVMIPSDTKVNEGYDLFDAETEDDYAENTGVNPNETIEKRIVGDIYSKYNGQAPSTSVDEGITKIGDRAFYKNESLHDVTLPETLQSIGDFAFARTNLRNIIIPEGTTDIGYGAFYNCNILENAYIPTTIENIELGAFDGTRWLDDWKRNDEASDFLIVGDRILLAYKGNDSNVLIPEGVNQIGPGAFYNNNSITSVILPASVQKIEEDAFNGCTNLSKVTLNEGLISIEDRAFKNTAIEALYIPDSVNDIGLGAFDLTGNGSKLKTVIFNGEDVPNVSYNDTASRASAKELRTRAFEGAYNAIVSGKCNLDSGTMFNPAYLGFDGCVYSVDNAGSIENGLLLQKAIKQPDISGNVIIDPNVQIGAEKYTMSNVKPEAFKEYADYGKWCDYPPTKVSIAGNTSATLNTLLDTVNESINPGVYAKSPGIKVSLSGSIFPEGGYASAKIPGDNSGYVMAVSENTTDKDAINAAFNEAYGINPDASAAYISIDLFDENGVIPIHKLGTSKMEVSIPVPKALNGRDGVTICSLDENGLLSELSSSISQSDAGDRIDFVTSHCSSFVIFCKTLRNVTYNSEDTGNIFDSFMAAVNPTDNGDMISAPEAQGIGAFSSNVMNTLHKETGGIEIKWFVVVILLALAGILALYKPRQKA